MPQRVMFDRPPVIEVVCGVQFDALPLLRVPLIGLYWSAIRKEFSEIEERPPIATVIEGSGDPSIELQFVSTPPLPRVWLINKHGSNLIQIQRDRFLYNWKKVSENDGYPSYDKVIVEFDAHLNRFREFLRAEQLGDLVHRQYELTYVNHIGKENGLDLADENAILVDHIRSAKPDRYLPMPDAFNWRSSYPLPGENGRLHVQAQTAIRKDGDRIVRIDLTARGIPNDNAESARRDWFDLAHDWITHGFADLTNPEVQNRSWNRKQ